MCHSTTDRRARELFAALVGRRTGIVRRLRWSSTTTGDAELFHCAAQIADASRSHPQSRESESTPWSTTVAGSGESKEASLLATFGEALERYLAASRPTSSGPMCAASQLDQPYLEPASLVHFSAEQYAQQGFPFQPWRSATDLAWVLGQRLGCDKPLWLPAFSVFLPHWPRDGEPLVAPGLSTGLSCAHEVKESILFGVFEVIERDALAVTWLKGASPPPIPNPRLLDWAGHLLPPLDDCRAYDLTSDIGLPVALVVCRGQGSHGMLLSVGSACHVCPRTALRKAALEASQDRIYVRHLLGHDPHWEPGDNCQNVTNFSHHARLYSIRPVWVDEAFAFLDQNRVTSRGFDEVRGGGGDGTLERVLDRLRSQGLEGAWFDLGQPWSRELGLYVTRVIIPGLVPLHGHHGLAHRAHPRLATWRDALPNAGESCYVEGSPYPHPFP